jgi:hypothetical protein
MLLLFVSNLHSWQRMPFLQTDTAAFGIYAKMDLPQFADRLGWR